MKPRFILPLLPILLAMFMVAGSNKAQAEVSVGVGIGIGGGHHYYRGGGVEYTTVDPGYSNWAPVTDPVYVAPVIVEDPYVYASPSIEFGGWYGGGYGGGGHSRYTGSGHSGGGRSGGGGHRR